MVDGGLRSQLSASIEPTRKRDWTIRQSVGPDLADLIEGYNALKRNPDWVEDLCSVVDHQYRGLREPMHLAVCSAITSSLPPVPYGLRPFRANLNTLLVGSPGSGKGVAMDILLALCTHAIEYGVGSSAALQGSMDKFGWVPGKAYEAKRHLLLIRELLQSTRRGEHFQDLPLDLNESLEYPHRVMKRLASFGFSQQGKINSAAKLYPDVKFARNEFGYSSPFSVVAGTFIQNMQYFRSRVSEGFLNRFVIAGIEYDIDQAQLSVRNFWEQIAREDNGINKEQLEYFRKCFKALYWTSTEFAKVIDREPIRLIELPDRHRRIFADESVNAVRESFEQVSSASRSNPPLLFRACQDLYRIALADAVSRRFSETETSPGVITIDDRATEAALTFLPAMVKNNTWLMKEVSTPSPAPIVPEAQSFWEEFRIIHNYGAYHGLTESEFSGICTYEGIGRERSKKRLDSLVKNKLVERDQNGRLFSHVRRLMMQG
jgi:hypothetical protein